MPIVRNEEMTATPTTGFRRDLPAIINEPEVETNALDTTAAAFRLNNTVSSLIASAQDRASVPQMVDSADYDVWSDIKDTPYATFADRFVGSEAKTAAARIKVQIDRENADRQTIQNAGFGGVVASVAAGLTDPITLLTSVLPFGAAANAGRLANAGRVALMTAATEIPVEMALQETQQTRTFEDGVLNIGGAALVGGLLGSAISRSVPLAERDELAKRMLDEITPTGVSTAGAASVRPVTTLQEEGLAAGAEWYAKTMGKVSPLLRTLTSPSKVTRETAQRLAETPVMLDKNLSGKATSQAIESRIKRTMGDWWAGYKDRTDAYKEMRVRLKEAGQKAPSRKEFNEMVAYAMRRGDKSDVPEVARAAAATRKIVIEPWRKMSEDLGLLKNPLKEAQGKSDEKEIEKFFKAQESQLFDTYRARVRSAVKEGVEGEGDAEIGKTANEINTELQRSLDLERTTTEQTFADSQARIDKAQTDYDTFIQNAKGELDSTFAAAKAEGEQLGEIGAVNKANAADKLALGTDILKSVRERAVEQARSLVEAAEREHAQLYENVRRNMTRDKARIEILKSKLKIEAIRRKVAEDIAKARKAFQADAAKLRKEAGDIDIPTSGAERITNKALREYRRIVKDAQKELKRVRASESKLLRIEGRRSRVTSKSLKEGAKKQLSKLQAGDIKEFRKRAQAVAERTATDDDPLINEMAQLIQKKTEGKLRDVVHLPKVDPSSISHVVGAESYLIRQYNFAKIKADQAGWRALLIKGFRQQGIDELDAADLATEVTRKITGSETGTLDLDVIPTSGRFKDRKITLPDELLEDYLVNDIDSLTQAYLRSIAPEVEFTREFGDRDMSSVIQSIKDDYGVMKEAAQGNEKQLQRLTDAENADIRDLAAMRDRLYGRYGVPSDPSSFFVRALRFSRAYNYTRMLGGQVISAITDAARLMMIYGAPKMMATSMKLATSLKAMKIGKANAQRMGIALDMVLNTRGVSEGALDEASSFAEQRFMKRLSDGFSIATMQAPWNTVMKSWSSIMSQDDILRAAKKIANGDTVSTQNMRRFASLGIDEDGMKAIAAQFEKHGANENGLAFGNSDAWDDKVARDLFENAVIREADTAVLTPGVGDTPLFYSKEWGKTLLQFKSFGLASTTRLVAPMLQGLAQGDLKTIAGIPALFGFSTAVYVLKQLAAEQPITDDPTQFAKEVVDKSGMLAYGGDILFPMLWQFGNDDLSRWSDRQPIETLMGPTAGTVGDIYTSRWPTRVMDGEVSDKDVHKMRRLIPGQNIWYIRGLLNRLEEQAQ